MGRAGWGWQWLGVEGLPLSLKATRGTAGSIQTTNHTGRNSVPPPSPSSPLSPSSKMPLVHFLNKGVGGLERRDAASLNDKHTHTHTHTFTYAHYASVRAENTARLISALVYKHKI